MSNVPPIVERCRRPPRVVPTDARASSLKLARARTINVASFAVDASRASSHRACVGVCDTEAVGIARAPTAGDKKARENDSVSSHDSRTRFRHDVFESPHPTRGFGKTSTIVDTPPMSTLGVDAYGSDDGASAEDDASAEDEDGFVGPTRPPGWEIEREGASDGEVDEAYLASMRDDDDDDDAGEDEGCHVPARWVDRVRIPPEPASVAATETQARVNEIFLEALQRGLTPSTMMFASSTFRNPGFMETCSADLGEDAFATGAAFAFDGEPVPEEDFYGALAQEQKLVTEKYLADRNGISFRSAGKQAAPAAAAQVPEDEARQATINAAIAKARVEARIALEKAGRVPPS